MSNLTVTMSFSSCAVSSSEATVQEQKKLVVHSGASRADTTGHNKKQLVIPTAVKWLLPQKRANPRPRRHLKEKGHVEWIRRYTENRSRIWDLVELSLPLFMDRKFHVVSVSELMKANDQCRYQAITSWFVSFSEAFGLQFMQTCQVKYQLAVNMDKHKGVDVFFDLYKGGEHEEEVVRWQQSVDELLALVAQCRTITSSPVLSDGPLRVATFLLEPCVLIQLPWSTVLLHQWLAAAFLEVLKLEKESLELRHWLLPCELASSAGRHIQLLAQLKERVMLGFLILFTQVTHFPQVDSRHPGWILDHVVLPSLAILEFILSGKALCIVCCIKRIAWSKSESGIGFENRRYIRSDLFKINSKYQDLFELMTYSPVYWTQYFHQLPPFSATGPASGYIALENLIKLIDSEVTDPERMGELEDLVKQLGNDEKIYWNDVKHEQDDLDDLRLDAKGRICLTLVTAKKRVLGTGMLPAETWPQINKALDNQDSRTSVEGKTLFTAIDMGAPSKVQSAVAWSLLHRKLHSLLVGSEVEQGIMARTVNYGFEITEREQIVKLAHVLGLMLNVTPVAVNLDKTELMSVEHMTKQLEDVQALRSNQNREWLWSQFSAEWRKPVSLEERSVKVNIKFPDLVKKYENRIGRIIFNVAQKCFSVYEKGGEIFPHWQTVQYIVPCYVALYHMFLENPEEKFSKIVFSNYIKLLHNILQFYEEYYQSWHTLVTPRPVPMEITSEGINQTCDMQLDELFVTVSHYKDLTNFILNTHIGHAEPISEELHRFQIIADGLMEWPETVAQRKERKKPILAHYNLRAWLLRSLCIYKDLYAICISAWDFPLPGSVHSNPNSHTQMLLLINPNLAEMYHSDAMVHAVETTALKCWHNIPDHESVPANIVENIENIKKTRQSLYQLRFNLHMMVSESDNKTILVRMALELSRMKLQESYCYLKKFKLWLGPCKIQYPEHLPNVPPTLRQASLHYLNNEFTELEKMLTALQFSIQQPGTSTSTADTPSAPEESKKKKKKNKGKKEVQEASSAPAAKKVLAPKLCRNCPRTEDRRGTFLPCDKCQQDKYPDVNFYCSKACKYAWWKEEHMAEHLEFDLGLADFSHLDLDK